MGDPLPCSRAPERGGDAGGDRMVGSMLNVRRAGCFRAVYWDGSDGNGGTFLGGDAGPELVAGRPGD